MKVDQVNNHFAKQTNINANTTEYSINFSPRNLFLTLNYQYMIPMHSLNQARIFTFIAILFIAISINEATFPDCNKAFSCGTFHNISYPFTGGSRPPYCGHPDFLLTCNNNISLELTINWVSYRVIALNQTDQTLILSRSDLYNTPCLPKRTNASLTSEIFKLGYDNQELILFYGCSSESSDELDDSLQKYSCDSNFVYFLAEDDNYVDRMKCSESVKVPVHESLFSKLMDNPSSLGETLKKGFSVKYNDPYDVLCEKCYGDDRYCGFQEKTGGFVCICGDKICPESNSNSKPIVIGAAVGGAALFCFVVGLSSFFYLRRKKQAVILSRSKDSSTPSFTQGLPVTKTSSFSRSTPYTSMSSDPEKGSNYFGVTVFRYSELEEATNSFDPTRELGDGGFGTVYYGELIDGRKVAVKRLYENNCKRVVQFMNEVEILTRLKHPNLVQLYGCTSRRSRELILVYEYISNGTVADHLHGKQAKSSLLTWDVRLNIAIETAAALAYLHASDIIHRDVKTNNILLDNNFTVKVADFGLSRLFPDHVTHVSTAPQGTPGYVDPEYYKCYQLTAKSDVYSFGVVLIELISSQQAVDINRHRQDVNLASMAINKIQNHALDELVDLSLGFETDFSVRRTMTLMAELAFRCLQEEREMRPSMEESLEILKGIKNGGLNAEVMDMDGEDDIGLLRSDPYALSPDSDKCISSSITSEKWMQIRSM